MGTSGTSGRRRSSARHPPAATRTPSEPSKEDVAKRAAPKRKRAPARPSRNTHGASQQAKEHHQVDAAALDHGVSVLDKYIAALSSLSKSGDPAAAFANLNLSSPTAKRDWSSVDTLGVMTEVIDENPKPSLEYVLGVLGCPEVPKSLEERQRGHGARAFTAHFRNRSIRKKRESLEPHLPASTPPSVETEKSPSAANEMPADDNVRAATELAGEGELANPDCVTEAKQEQSDRDGAHAVSISISANQRNIQNTPEAKPFAVNDNTVPVEDKVTSNVERSRDVEMNVVAHTPSSQQHTDSQVAQPVEQIAVKKDVEMEQVEPEPLEKTSEQQIVQPEKQDDILEDKNTTNPDSNVTDATADKGSTEKELEKPKEREESVETDPKKEAPEVAKKDADVTGDLLKTPTLHTAEDTITKTLNQKETIQNLQGKPKPSSESLETGEKEHLNKPDSMEVVDETESSKQKEHMDEVAKHQMESEDDETAIRNRMSPKQGSNAGTKEVSADVGIIIDAPISAEQHISVDKSEALQKNITADAAMTPVQDSETSPKVSPTIKANKDKPTPSDSTEKQPNVETEEALHSEKDDANTPLPAVPSNESVAEDKKESVPTAISKETENVQDTAQISGDAPAQLPANMEIDTKGTQPVEEPETKPENENLAPVVPARPSPSADNASKQAVDTAAAKNVKKKYPPFEKHASSKSKKAESAATSKPTTEEPAAAETDDVSFAKPVRKPEVAKSFGRSVIKERTRTTRETTRDNPPQHERLGAIVPLKKARYRRDPQAIEKDEDRMEDTTQDVPKGTDGKDTQRPNKITSSESSDSLTEAISRASRMKAAASKARKISGGVFQPTQPTRKPPKKAILKEHAEAKFQSRKQEQSEASDKKAVSEAVKPTRKDKGEASKTRKVEQKGREKPTVSRRSANASTEVTQVVPRQTRLRRESSHLCEDGSSAMADRDPFLIECYNVWRAISKDKITIPFRKPVTARDAPGYFDIVKNPMDLSTVKKHLEDKTIQTPEDFFEEMMLICSNAMLFNDVDSDLYELAIDLRRLMRKSIRPVLRRWRDSRPEGERENRSIDVLLEKGSDESESDESDSAIVASGTTGRGSTRYPSRRSGAAAASSVHKEPTSSPRETTVKKKKPTRGRKRTTQELSDGEDGGEYLTIRRTAGRGGRRGGSTNAGTKGSKAAAASAKKGKKSGRAGSSAVAEEVVEEKKSVKKRRLSGRRKRGDDE